VTVINFSARERKETSPPSQGHLSPSLYKGRGKKGYGTFHPKREKRKREDGFFTYSEEGKRVRHPTKKKERGSLRYLFEEEEGTFYQVVEKKKGKGVQGRNKTNLGGQKGPTALSHKKKKGKFRCVPRKGKVSC